MHRNPKGRREGENSDETGHIQGMVQTEGEKVKALWRILEGVEIRVEKRWLKESQTGACIAQTCGFHLPTELALFLPSRDTSPDYSLFKTRLGCFQRML